MNILIACGGTAGHIFPGLALAEELKKEKAVVRIVLVVSTHPRDREFLAKIENGFLKELYLEKVSSIGLPDNFSFKYIPFAARLLWAFVKSLSIILRYRPSVVVGFGGYASFAPVIIAHLMGIPTLIHEQNLFPGRANRLLARIADRIATSFEETNKFFSPGKLQAKIVKTGLPLRRQFLHAETKFPLDTFVSNTKTEFNPSANRFTILVLGGSQGSHNINKLILDWLKHMDKTALQRLRLIHLTGKNDFRYIQERYAALGTNFSVFDFLEDMVSAYKSADLVIGRSGASTIFEAATFALPSIFIPHSGGTRHQKGNASFLARSSCAIVLDEENASGKDLEKIVWELMDNVSRRKELSQKIGMLKNPQASFNLKKEVVALCKNQ